MTYCLTYGAQISAVICHANLMRYVTLQPM